MNKLLNRALAFLQHDEAAASLEYALLVGLIAIAILGAVSSFGTQISASFTKSTASLPY